MIVAAGTDDVIFGIQLYEFIDVCYFFSVSSPNKNGVSDSST